MTPIDLLLLALFVIAWGYACLLVLEVVWRVTEWLVFAAVRLRARVEARARR